MSASRLALAYFSTVAAATYLGSLSTVLGVSARELSLDKFVEKVPDSLVMAFFGSLFVWPVAAVVSVVAIALIGAMFRLRIVRTTSRRMSVSVSVLAATGAILGAVIGNFSVHVQHHAREVPVRQAFVMFFFVSSFLISGAICGAVFAAIMGAATKNADVIEG